MTNITLQKRHRTLWHFIPGLTLSTVITRVALRGGPIPVVTGAGSSALTFTILLRMASGNTIYPYIRKSCDGGVLFAKRYLLRLGIILYGFRPTFSQIADVGISGIIVGVLTLSSTLLLICFLGQKVFGLDKYTSWLIGVGSSICGTAAALAARPVVRAGASKVTVAVATVTIFGTVTIFLYPAIYPLMSQWFGPEVFGIYIGSIVHGVAQMMTMGHVTSPDAENAAVISKVLCVMMLAPFLILLAAHAKQLSGVNSGKKSEITIPWFATLFIVVAVFSSFHLLSQGVASMLVILGTSLLAMAVAALGPTTHVSALKKTGVKPLLMVPVLFAWLVVGGGAISYMIQGAIA